MNLRRSGRIKVSEKDGSREMLGFEKSSVIPDDREAR